jgi:hypothetical protein
MNFAANVRLLPHRTMRSLLPRAAAAHFYSTGWRSTVLSFAGSARRGSPR